MAMIIWGHIMKENGKTIKFFFPLILLYILILPFYFIAFIVYIFFLILSENNSPFISYLKIFLNLPTIFSAMKDLEIVVNNYKEDIKIYIK